MRGGVRRRRVGAEDALVSRDAFCMTPPVMLVQWVTKNVTGVPCFVHGARAFAWDVVTLQPMAPAHGRDNAADFTQKPLFYSVSGGPGTIE